MGDPVEAGEAQELAVGFPLQCPEADADGRDLAVHPVNDAIGFGARQGGWKMGHDLGVGVHRGPGFAVCVAEGAEDQAVGFEHVLCIT